MPDEPNIGEVGTVVLGEAFGEPTQLGNRIVPRHDHFHRRRVDLPDTSIRALEAHRARADAASPDGLVFTDSRGGPARKGNLLRRWFRPLLKRAGLPPVRFHGLRHTHATLLLAQGAHPKVVQERLGHSQIAMTLDVYSHAVPSMQREAARRLDDLLDEG